MIRGLTYFGFFCRLRTILPASHRREGERCLCVKIFWGEREYRIFSSSWVGGGLMEIDTMIVTDSDSLFFLLSFFEMCIVVFNVY